MEPLRWDVVEDGGICPAEVLRQSRLGRLGKPVRQGPAGVTSDISEIESNDNFCLEVLSLDGVRVGVGEVPQVTSGLGDILA